MVGQKFGRLTVVCPFYSNKQYKEWECICECGKKIITSTSHLKSGHTKSCGCLRKEMTSLRRIKHNGSYSPTYKVWASMKRRCKTNKWYTIKNIKVCDRWKSYINFLSDMGEKPNGYSIERKDNNGDYCPSNCCWIPLKEQANNKSTTVYLEYKGVTMIMKHWADKLGISKSFLHYLLHKKNLKFDVIANRYILLTTTILGILF